MLRKLLLVATVAALVTRMSAQTVDEIIAKNIQARGGIKRVGWYRAVRLC